jgi:hypothetical protein
MNCMQKNLKSALKRRGENIAKTRMKGSGTLVRGTSSVLISAGKGYTAIVDEGRNFTLKPLFFDSGWLNLLISTCESLTYAGGM